MKKNLLPPLAVAVMALGLIHASAADGGPSPVEQKLRDALRTTMLQLRDAQTQMASLQVAQAQSDKDKADLSAKIDTLNAQIKTINDQAIADKATADKTIADLKQGNVDLVTQIVNTLSTRINALNKPSPNDKAVLDKAIADMKAEAPDVAKQLDLYGSDIQLWTTGYNEYVDFSNKSQAERNRQAAEVITLERLVNDRETKNLELYKTGTEILDRYEKFSLGDALGAKEPFTGLTRIKLQELVQDYKDKLTETKVVIGQPPSTPPETNPNEKKMVKQ